MLRHLPVLFQVSEEYPVAFHCLVLTRVVFCSADPVQSANEMAKRMSTGYLPEC